jgi:hypothetical protein
MFMLCSLSVAERSAGTEAGLERDAAQSLRRWRKGGSWVSQGGKGDARLRNSKNAAAVRPEEMAKKEIFLPLCADKSLITRDSRKQMEGKGRIWKGVSGLRCARLRIDRASTALGWTSVAHFGRTTASTFPKAGDRQEAGVRTIPGAASWRRGRARMGTSLSRVHCISVRMRDGFWVLWASTRMSGPKGRIGASKPMNA